MRENHSHSATSSMRDPKAIGIAVAVIAVAGVWWMSSGKDSAREFASFDAEALRVSDVVGSVRVEVTNDPEMTVTVHGPSDALKRLDVMTRAGTLVIDQDRGLGWIRIFGLRNRDMEISVRVPRGTPVAIDHLSGELYVGNIFAPIDIQGHITGGSVGDVTSAAIALSGDSNLSIGEVSGALAFHLSGNGHATVKSAGTTTATVSGNGNFSMGDVADATFSVSGNGSVAVGEIRSGLDLSLSGNSRAAIRSLNGTANISISGDGEAHIVDGRAGPFAAVISGSGELVFGGVAVDPDLSVAGAGHIALAAHEGTLTADGDNIVVNGERVANR